MEIHLEKQYIEKVAAGIRAMKHTPDAFLCCLDDPAWDKPSICEIPVFHSVFVQNTMTDEDVPFIPIWRKSGDYVIDRKRFNEHYEM